jgi:hypothetical protein
MIVDLTKYREEKNPYTSEEDVWESLINLSSEEMMIITKSDGQIRVSKVRISRFEINPEELIKENK